MENLGIKLTLTGVVQNVKEVEFENKKSKILQFLDMQNNKLVLIDIKAEEDVFDKLKDVKAGKKVDLEVAVNSYNNKIYYKVI